MRSGGGEGMTLQQNSYVSVAATRGTVPLRCTGVGGGGGGGFKKTTVNFCVYIVCICFCVLYACAYIYLSSICMYVCAVYFMHVYVYF